MIYIDRVVVENNNLHMRLFDFQVLVHPCRLLVLSLLLGSLIDQIYHT